MLSAFPRRAFAFDPDLAIFEDFFFPDGNYLLQFANGPLAGFEGRVAVRSADGDDHAGLSYFQTSSAMNNADVRDLKALMRFMSQPLQLAQGHGRVGFIDQIKCSAPARPLARVTVERNGCAAFGENDASRDGADVDGCGG